MRHTRVISCRRPSKAQFEPFLELVGLLNAIVSLIANAASTFGFELKEP